ncbi:glycosyltransferase [Natronomonas sp. F2-12]|uniref:Glycosyltransferase n=1 Tax=Natronomonas aquatica TaxID=2841590 RepID=A0A9R1D5I4_9EURY|nr:glycosyltransferase [Natronomonas aquatica]MCQ4333116.1 glycosyltransferase [Natronomonas aquatica]
MNDQTSVIVVTYNSENVIERCVDSILTEDPHEIIVVDSGSTDTTTDILRDDYPTVSLFELEDNPGYGSCVNHAVRQISSEYLIVMNPDTELHSGAIRTLVEPLIEQPRRITVPQIRTFDGTINTCGNREHMTGLAFTRGFGEHPEAHATREQLAGFSGACFGVCRDTFEELGGFEEELFLYMEDAELSWRAHSKSVEVLLVPAAIVYHEYRGPVVDAKKLYHLEFGRYVILRRYYDFPTALLFAPSLLLTELLTWGYALLIGIDGIRMKSRGVFDGLRVDIETEPSADPSIFAKLDITLPEVELTGSSAGRLMRRIGNSIYKMNYALYRFFKDN